LILVVSAASANLVVKWYARVPNYGLVVYVVVVCCLSIVALVPGTVVVVVVDEEVAAGVSTVGTAVCSSLV